MLAVTGTPVETYFIEGGAVAVKREDLCAPAPGPAFSKIRGVEKHIRGRTERAIGVLDTYHSKAGWGVTWVCRALGRKTVVFYPEYRGDIGLRDPQQNALDLGATLVSLPAGRSAILYHRAKAMMKRLYPMGYMMPNALKTPETVAATAAEVGSVGREFFEEATWVVSVSSGTIAAGVVRGLTEGGARGVTVVLHLGYSRPRGAVLRYVESMAGGCGAEVRLEVVDEGYAYRDSVPERAPFPCNEWYDAKAWKWLCANRERLGDRVLFWNIGA